MKKLYLLAVGLALVSCSKISIVKPDPKGSVQLSVLADTAIKDIVKSQVSDYVDVPDKSAYDLILTDAGQNLWSGKVSSWNGSKYALDMPVSKTLKFEASYGDKNAEGFEKPYFYGSQEFSFVWGDITVGIPVKFCKTLLKIQTSEFFDIYFPSYEFVVTTASGQKLKYSKDEQRALFLNPGKVVIEANLTAYDGTSHTLEPKVYDNLEAACCYTSKFDVTQIGGQHIAVVFDDSMETIDFGEILLQEGTLDLGSLQLGYEQEPLTKAIVPVEDDFPVYIADSRGEVIYITTYAETKTLDGKISLPVGTYTLTVKSTDSQIPSAGFDCPLYSASESFKIYAGKETVIENPLVCRLMQAKVSVNVSDGFLSRITADSNIIFTLSNGQILEYPISFSGGKATVSHSIGYFLIEEQGLSLDVLFEGYIDGHFFTTSKRIENVEKASSHKVDFNITSS